LSAELCWDPLGELQRSPRPASWIKRERVRGNERRRKGRTGKGRKGKANIYIYNDKYKYIYI